VRVLTEIQDFSIEALSTRNRALLKRYRARLTKYRALLRRYRALLTRYRESFYPDSTSPAV